MAALRSLLAIYAAFDQSVVEANDPEWSARVEKVLPGTTGEGQRGWSSDVEKWLKQLAPEPRQSDARLPDWRNALSYFDGLARRMSAAALTDQPEPPAGPADDADDLPPERDLPEPETLAPAQVAYFLYGLTLLEKLVPEAPLTGPFAPLDLSFPRWEGSTQTLDSFFQESDNPFDYFFGLAVAVPSPPIPGVDDPESTSGLDPQERANGLKGLLAGTTFATSAQWTTVMAEAVQRGYISPEIAAVPIPVAGLTTSYETATTGSKATSAVTEIDDVYCAVMTTDSWRKGSSLTVNKVKNIADPRNWDKLLNSFFCAMEPDQPDFRGVSRILEHVSLDKDVFRMKTALKYWKEDFGVADGQGVRGGIINYELADASDRARLGDSGLVLVDSGYIHISHQLPDGSDGVRVRTSKMVAVQGGSVTATSMFILFMGWGPVGDSMFFRDVAGQGALPPQLKTWSTNPERRADEFGPAPTQTGTTQTDGAQFAQTPDMSGMLVRQAATMWASYVKDTTEATGKIVEKWYKRELTPQDMVTYTTEMTGRLASEPWRYLAKVSDRLGTTRPGSQTPSQDTNGGGSP